MNEIVIKTSVWKSAVVLSGYLCFVACGAFIIQISSSWTKFAIGVLSMAFFGFGFIVILRRVLDRRPRIVVDETGIVDRTSGMGQIDWTDINGFVAAKNRIVVEVKTPEKYLDRMSSYRRWISKLDGDLGLGLLNLNLSLADTRPKELYEVLMEKLFQK